MFHSLTFVVLSILFNIKMKFFQIYENKNLISFQYHFSEKKLNTMSVFVFNTYAGLGYVFL